MWGICGENKRKTVVITAGVHGCEYVGIETAKKIYNEVDTIGLYGNLVIFPIVTRSGFYGGLKQVVAEDNKNLNRILRLIIMELLQIKLHTFLKTKSIVLLILYLICIVVILTKR